MKYFTICLLVLLCAGCDAGGKPSQAPRGVTEVKVAEAPPPAFGPVVTAGDITISGAWAPVTPIGARVAAGYFTLKNGGAVEDRLLSAGSRRAKSIELHEMTNEGGMMTMRRVDNLALKPGEEIKLEPGHMHLMLLDPTLPFVASESLPITLTFERAGKIELQLLVRPRDLTPGAHSPH